MSYVAVGTWNKLTRANRLWSILRVDIDISMDTESDSCKSGVPFKYAQGRQGLSALPVISTFHIDRLIVSPGRLTVGTWNTGFTECKASEKYAQGRHRPTVEIWTRSRIHVTAAFLSSPQTAHLPEPIPRTRFPETEAIMKVRPYFNWINDTTVSTGLFSLGLQKPLDFFGHEVCRGLRIGPKLRPQHWCALCTRPKGKVRIHFQNSFSENLSRNLSSKT